MAKRILLTTTGSFGDLHPFLAIGLGLNARGHSVTIASSNVYRTKVEQAGLSFAPMGPHLDVPNSELIRKVMNARTGPEYLMRKILYPGIADAYAEVMRAIPGADVIVTHPITFASQIAAEKTGMPWVSTITAPLSIMSRYDPPVLAPAPFLAKLRGVGPTVNGLVIQFGRWKTRPWMKPVTKFRASLGMAPGPDPLFEGQHSPKCVLAMFSRVMAEPQRDWPPQTKVIGFPFYDQAEHGQRLDPGLEKFLDSGPPPVVFTLGSSAVHDAGSFYHESLAAVKKLGCRAVLLAGPNTVHDSPPPGVAIFPYAPFSLILPRSACVVHQGGVGTCGQALAAAKPMLVMPYAFDQFDNAARLERLGVARMIRRRSYRARRVAAELAPLLSDSRYAQRAAEASRRMAAEDAVTTACVAIENA